MDVENTLDKKEELCELFEGYSYEIHQKDSEEYCYMKDGDICITVKNNDGSKKLYVDLNEEFTLSFGAFHSHYDCSQSSYEELIGDLKGILDNRIGAASIYHFYNEKLIWMSSLMISIEEVTTQTVRQIFHHVYHTKDYRNDLDQYGGEVRYDFWDSQYDKIILIDKKKYGDSF